LRLLQEITSPGADQIPAGALHSEKHKLLKLIWKKDEMPHQWTEATVVPIHKKGDETGCSNYLGI
jgi:hypothetical protein